jgi:hypothetical protein
MGARSAGGGAPRCGEARPDGAKTKIKASTNVKSVRAPAAKSRRIVQHRKVARHGRQRWAILFRRGAMIYPPEHRSTPQYSQSFSGSPRSIRSRSERRPRMRTGRLIATGSIMHSLNNTKHDVWAPA